MSLANRREISTALSTRVGAKGRLAGFCVGLVGVGDYIPETPGEYWQYRRLMHDILCHGMIDSGHFSQNELQLDKIGAWSNSKKLNQQKPDLFTVNGTQLDVCEVTLTYRPDSDWEEKMSKYSDLFDTIRTFGYTISYSVILVDLTSAEWESAIPSMSTVHLSMLSDFIDNLRFIHSDKDFGHLRLDTKGFENIETFTFNIQDSVLSGLVKSATTIDVPPEQIKDDLQGHVRPDDFSSSDYLDSIASSILENPWRERPVPNPKPFDAQGLQVQWDEYKAMKPTTDKIPRALQLGSPLKAVEFQINYDHVEVLTSLKDTTKFGGYLDMVKASLSVAIPGRNETIKLPLSQEQLEKEQLDGPGRKAALRRLGLKQERKPPRHIGISQSHEVTLTSFYNRAESMSRESSILEMKFPSYKGVSPIAESTLEAIYETFSSSPAGLICKFYQRISQEITLNSMRRRKTREYVLGFSGFEGIFFLVAPGPQLRTESNTEFVKIISLVEPLVHDLSAPWLPTGNHWESDWLSVDTDRLKHWQRTFDRVLLSGLCNSERLVNPETNLRSAFMSEVKSDNVMLLSLVYLENKQLTSVTNQNIRYLWMKALGDKQFDGLIKKFPGRVGSILQSVIMSRAVEVCLTISRSDLSEYLRIPKAIRNEETGSYDETTTGVLGRLPRLFTRGEHVPISYNLNEIYWCMAYNKDRQNAAQDALSILKKILAEESKYKSEISRREGLSKYNYFMGNTTMKEDINHIHSPNPESHYYSRRAVDLGISLQDKHEENFGSTGQWRNPEKIDQILGKTLDNFATFKASVKEVCTELNLLDLEEVNKIGRRTKAIELVAELVGNEKLKTSLDVAMSVSGDKNLNFSIFIQIFKKGQVGGVREIIILYIKARILFNILEELCRLLAKSDRREILTKGKDKRLMMRGDYEEVVSSFPAGTPIKVVRDSFDMTTWAQKFIPTIFCSIFEHHFKEIPGLQELSRFIFFHHSNKVIEYPKKLVEQWMRNPEITHQEAPMQEAKERFLRDGNPTFVNHSNMCQGIPHYASTVLALSCLSLRDKLFNTCLEKLGQQRKICWKTRVGSDDKGTITAIDMTDRVAYSQFLLLGQCELAAERLHSMELSVKSASGLVMYELNSAFMANLETLSPTIKFTLAAVDVIGTTSCTKFINESYSRVRQLRENGGSSILCAMAHVLNSMHFEDIFDVGEGGSNNPCDIFNLRRDQIPFDLGIYPFFDMDLQDLVGPEYHNYMALKNSESDNRSIRLLYTSLSDDSQIFDHSLEDTDSGLLKKDHFGIQQGAVRQLTKMRERIGASGPSVREFFDKNPFQIVRGPETLEEVRMNIHAKLFTSGAAESLRRTSPVIYIGRLSAFRTKKAWNAIDCSNKQYDVESERMVPIAQQVECTYRDFVRISLSNADTYSPQIKDLKSMIPILFPQHESFEIISQFCGKFSVMRSSKRIYSQAVRTWAVNNFNYEFTGSLKAMMETSFGLSQGAPKEDVEELKKLMGLKLQSLTRFVSECEAAHVRPLDMLNYMRKVVSRSKAAKVQTFAFGPSTGSLHLTALSIKRYNHMVGATMLIDEGLDENQMKPTAHLDSKLDTLKLYTNLRLMECNQSLITKGEGHGLGDIELFGTPFIDLVTTTLRSIKSISGFDHTTQKVVKFAASQLLTKDEFKEKMTAWKTLNFSYIKRQKKTVTRSGKALWSGDLKVLVNLGKEAYTINIRGKRHYLETRTVVDPELLLQSLREMCRVLDVDSRSFFSFRGVRKGDLYLTDGSKMLLKSEADVGNKSCLILETSSSFNYKRLQDFDTFGVETKYDERAGSVEVYLSDGDQRSATIAHFPGVYLTTRIPKSIRIPDSLNYLGLPLNVVFKNRDWFFNGRLPSMSDSEALNFLKNDVDFLKVLSLRDRDASKAQLYVEVRTEVQEESFALLSQPLGNVMLPMEFDEEGMKATGSMAQLFRETFDDLVQKQDLYFPEMDKNISWADDDFEELDPRQLEFYDAVDSLAKEAEGVETIRAMTYKKPQVRKNMAMISSLQQGSSLRERVINMFFRNGDVLQEELRDLPSNYLWLQDLGPYDQTTLMIRDSIKEIIITVLSERTGTPPNLIMETLSSKRRATRLPLRRFKIYIDDEDTEDLFSELMLEATGSRTRYEESDNE